MIEFKQDDQVIVKQLTPEQKIKASIIDQCDGYFAKDLAEDEIDTIYDELRDSDIQDLTYYFREGEVETNIACEYSRHYESKSVAAKMFDGSWVGWTYWYGGGKHSEPEEIDWMSDAYHLVCHEEEKLVVIQTFSKI
jgi:hypothetical protein